LRPKFSAGDFDGWDKSQAPFFLSHGFLLVKPEQEDAGQE